ncbi:MAG: hypothetical protein ACTS6G_02135 [Candidatus Hodgkinia cicadicola]
MDSISIFRFDVTIVMINLSRLFNEIRNVIFNVQLKWRSVHLT